MKRSLGERLMLTVLPFVAACMIRGIARLNRLEILGEESLRQLWAEGKNMILAFWHDQLLLISRGYRGPGARVLISASRDGELIARTVAHLGFDSVRGSSSRRGREAFRELLNLARQPLDLAITPDGPRGPRHQLKEGVVHLARLSKRPVVPLCFVCSRGHRFASWDRFLLPYPFGRGIFRYGEPLFFEEGEELQAFQARLQQAMEENERQARARLEEYGVSAV